MREPGAALTPAGWSSAGASQCVCAHNRSDEQLAFWVGVTLAYNNKTGRRQAGTEAQALPMIGCGPLPHVHLRNAEPERQLKSTVEPAAAPQSR